MEQAQLYILSAVPRVYWFVRLARALPTNTLTEPFVTGTIPGLPLQKISLGNVRIEEDEAYVVTAGSGTAAFRNCVSQDVWYRTVDYPNRLTSMNNSQAVLNENVVPPPLLRHRMERPFVHTMG